MSRITPKIKQEVEDFIKDSCKEAVSLITPESLKKFHLLKSKPSHIKDEDWIQNCRLIVHTIIQLSFDKRYNNEKSGEFVPLYSKVLKQNCGNNYNVYLDGLLNSSIIECDDIYSKKRHESFGFRLADKYACSAYKHVTLENPRKLTP